MADKSRTFHHDVPIQIRIYCSADPRSKSRPPVAVLADDLWWQADGLWPIFDQTVLDRLERRELAREERRTGKPSGFSSWVRWPRIPLLSCPDHGALTIVEDEVRREYDRHVQTGKVRSITISPS